MATRVTFLFVIGGLTALLLWLVVPEVLEGSLFEPDNYMRLVRVTQLAETGEWYNSSVPRSNAPYGETLHWTRPFDILLLFGAALLLPFLSFSKALFWAGVFLPPFLLLLTCYSAAWAARPVAGEKSQVLAMITVLAQVGIVQSSLPGRPDHHSLHLLIFMVTLGLVVRWIMTPFSRRLALWTGVLVGTGLWVGTEFLIPLALIFSGGLLFWVRDGKAFSEKNLWFSVGLLGILVGALPLERPPAELFTVEYDRISLPHALVAGLAVAFWAIVGELEKRKRVVDQQKGRVFAAAVGAIATMGALAAVFPAFFLGPEVLIDPDLTPLWRTFVAEDQPLVGSWGLEDIGAFFAFLGPILFGLPFLVWLWVKEENKMARGVWSFLGVSLLLLSVLAIYKLRFVPYPEAVVVLVSATLMSRILTGFDSIRGLLPRAALRSGAIFTIICGSLFLGLSLISAGMESEDGARLTSDTTCPITPMARLLSEGPLPIEASTTIAAHMDYGPELLYRTDHGVLGTPYHRNSQGIHALFSILTSTNPEEAKQLTSERGVGLILVCPAFSWVYANGLNEEEVGSVSLHSRLVAGEVPEWLEGVTLPPDVAGDFLLFRTRG